VTAAHGIDGLTSLVGRRLGPSSWIDVPQDRVDRFAEATGDHQWIHVDPPRAATGPFGGTIAHGYLTLSLTPVVLTEILEVTGFSLVVNYGCDRVRFPAPVPVGSRVRAAAVVDEVREIGGGVQLTVTLTYEIQSSVRSGAVAGRSDGQSSVRSGAVAGRSDGVSGGKPVCVAAILIRYYT
jgi:acyl dehydratase